MIGRCLPDREHEEDPVAAMDQLETTLFALQSWCLLPAYAVPEADSAADPDIIVGEFSQSE